MATPRSLTFALYQHWEIMETLVLLGREFPSFEPDQITTVISRCTPQISREDSATTLRQMLSSELLQPLPRSSSLQIHPLVLEFVRGLTREHELGLSEVLKARIEGIKGATAQLAEGLQAKDTDQLRQAAIRLSELLRQISQQLTQDRHAILDIAGRAKATDSNIPIGRRYSEVLTAFDNYIAPMAEMMDSGPSGTFYRHLEAAEHALDHAVETLTIQGGLYTQRLAMRQVAFQAKELRRLGREILKHCSDTLLPLRDEVRQHNMLSSAVSSLLGRVRKRGLSATLDAAELPRWRRDMPRRVSIGSEVLTIMSEARNYQPATVAFPDDEIVGSTLPTLDLIDELALVKRLRQSLPVPDLLQWLHIHYPQLSDATTLRLYHVLIERADWAVTSSEQVRHQILNTIRVSHFPHALSEPQTYPPLASS